MARFWNHCSNHYIFDPFSILYLHHVIDISLFQIDTNLHPLKRIKKPSHIPSHNIALAIANETLAEYFSFVAPHWITTIHTLLLIFTSCHMVLAKVVALWRLAYDLLPCEKEYETNDGLASYIQGNGFSLAIIIKSLSFFLS